MKLTFFGAAQTVTGSCYLVETEQTSFLVDCGLHQGSAQEDEMNHGPFPFDLDLIDFVLLTHAHIDHSGRIPKLYAAGFRKPVYATKATSDLCGIMLPDSGHIQEMEQEWQNRKNSRAGKPQSLPLYTVQNAIDACRLFSPVRYDTVFNPSPDVRVILRDAGHILGSAILEIWVSEGEGISKKETKIVFSGDLGNKGIPIMRDPAVIDGTDYLVIESTYGNRVHQNSTDKVEKFVKIINETIARGGNVIIPSFAVGRTQEIIYELFREEEKYQDQRTPFMQTPVYVDSPLAVSATRIFRENSDCYDDEARQYILDGSNPLDFPNLHFTKSVEESKALNTSDESKIIISASGMCDAGRIKHHLKHNLWREDSSVVFVGFQAAGTLGRRLTEGAKIVRIFDEEIMVKAHIEIIEGFSGHADLDGLLGWIDAMQQKPSQIILIHGEPDVIKAFGKSIDDRFKLPAHIAEFGESLVLGEPVKRGSAAKAPVVTADSRSLMMTQSLDILQTELALIIERGKNAVRQASSQEEREMTIARYKKQLQDALEKQMIKVR
jgi:metallo-beta-lactamase family protein